MRKKKENNKQNGDEDSREGCWSRDHRPFKIYQFREDSVCYVTPKGFCDQFGKGSYE